MGSITSNMRGGARRLQGGATGPSTDWLLGPGPGSARAATQQFGPPRCEEAGTAGSFQIGEPPCARWYPSLPRALLVHRQSVQGRCATDATAIPASLEPCSWGLVCGCCGGSAAARTPRPPRGLLGSAEEGSLTRSRPPQGPAPGRSLSTAPGVRPGLPSRLKPPRDPRHTREDPQAWER